MRKLMIAASLAVGALAAMPWPQAPASAQAPVQKDWTTVYSTSPTGGFVIGIVQSCLTAFSGVEIGDTSLAEYRTMAPFVLAIIALLWFARKRPEVKT